MATTIWKHWAALTALAAVLATSGAYAQQGDPPARVARLSQQDNSVQWAPAGSSDWQSAEPNRPLTSGDSIRVPAGSRAELHAGAHALRLEGPAQLQIGTLDDDEMRLTLAQGSLNLTMRDTVPGEDIEISTQNLALRIDRPGEFRIDADPASDTTRVSARSGTGTLYGENGESATLAPGQQARYVGRNLTATQLQGAGPRDALDQWAADRNRFEDQSQSARYVSRETIGYQELDANGEWSSHAEYGTVWYPRVTVSDWAPYRYGQWRWVEPWGWTWIDDARWGFAPFHYGRWVQVGPRWAWAPGPRHGRPAYAPALVGFGAPPAHRPPGPGRAHGPSAEWFPLGPGEVWRPGFGSQRYLDRVNRGHSPAGPGQPPRYRFEQRPDAVTALPPRDGVRSTVRERQPGIADPRLGLPDPTFNRPPSQERWQRDPQWQQQQRQQQRQNQADNELHQRHEQIRQEQLQRELQARQQQRMLQDQQTQQLRQQRQMQDQQQRQLQEPQRQHERFMRDQADAQRQQMDQQRQQVERQRRDTQPPRVMQQQERGERERRVPGGEPGVRSGARERP